MFTRYNPVFCILAIISIFYVYLVISKGDYYPVRSEILTIYIVDTIIFLTFVSFLISFHHRQLVKRQKKFKEDVFWAIKRFPTKANLYILLAMLLVFNWQFFNATFFLNEKKEVFLTYIDLGYTYHIITPVLIILCATRLSLGFGLPIIIAIGLFSFIAAVQNKTLFLLIIYFCYFFWWLEKLENDKTKRGNTRFAITVACILGAAAVTVLLQERRGLFLDGLIYNFESFFRFKIIGFYLSNELFAIETGFQGSITALFGIAAEKISVLLFGGYGLLTDGFIGNRVVIGPGNAQNAIYPWSVWIYSQLGALGLIFKYVILYGLFQAFLIARLNASLIYLLVVIVFVSLFRHPFMNTTDLYFFIAFIFLDIYLWICRTKFVWKLEKGQR